MATQIAKSAIKEMIRPIAPASQATQIEQSRAVAEVQAMVVVAQRAPRSEAEARNRVIESCRQLGLAERAFFKFPRGGATVAGSSIHLAVELARCWGNVNYGIKELNRNDAERVSEMVAYAWDVQTNTRAETSFFVPHKRDKRGGPEDLVDMREIYENNANNGARRLREMIFRIIPPWLRSEAEEECRATLERGESDAPLPQRIAQCVKLFADLGISKDRIEAKTGVKIDALTPVDLANLRISYNSIKRQEIDPEEEFPSTSAIELNEKLQGSAKPAAAPPQQTQPAEPKPETPVTSAASEASPANPWLISPEAFPNAASFMTEFRRQITDVVRTDQDVLALLNANAGRLAELPKPTRTALTTEANKRMEALR